MSNTTLTEEQCKMRAYGESNNAKVREEIEQQSLPSADSLINEVGVDEQR